MNRDQGYHVSEDRMLKELLRNSVLHSSSGEISFISIPKLVRAMLPLHYIEDNIQSHVICSKLMIQISRNLFLTIYLKTQWLTVKEAVGIT